NTRLKEAYLFYYRFLIEDFFIQFDQFFISYASNVIASVKASKIKKDIEQIFRSIQNEFILIFDYKNQKPISPTFGNGNLLIMDNSKIGNGNTKMDNLKIGNGNLIMDNSKIGNGN